MARSLNQVSLSALLAVEVLARRGTLARAAAELGVTSGAVSQKLIALEKRLGVTLFERTPTGLRPTALGQEIAGDLTRGFGLLARAVEKTESRAQGHLVISTPPVFAARWLIWRLPRFTALHPTIQVDLLAEPENRNPDQSDVDLCVRIGNGTWSDVTAEALFPQRVFPVCGLALAKDLVQPTDLLRVPIIRDTRSMFGWDVWLEPEGLAAADLPDGPGFSDAALCLDAAMTGAGAFLAWEALANDPLSAGRLIAPFAARRETGYGYWLISGAEGLRRPAQRAFRSWLIDALEREGLRIPVAVG